MDPSDVKNYVIDWNIRFPIDRWWRKKYNVAFNSSIHRESSFLDQLFEFEEDKIFQEINQKDQYEPGIGDWLKPQQNKTVADDIKSLRDEFKDIE